jgi:AcrR family transcriptional regulator
VLVDVAEGLFGATSIDAVSLRAVAREAGVAPAALTHHFPTKTALVGAVVQRRAEPLGEQVRTNLAALLEAETAPTVRELVEAVTLPFVEVIDQEPVRGLHWMKLFTSLALAEDPIWARGVGRAPSIAELFLRVASRALPHDDGLEQRVGIAMYSMLNALAGADLSGYGHPLATGRLDPEFVEQLLVFTSAGLMADRAELDPALSAGPV